MIHRVGVTAIAASQARPGPMKLKTSNAVVRILMKNTIMLKRQMHRKPVDKDTNSAC